MPLIHKGVCKMSNVSGTTPRYLPGQKFKTGGKRGDICTVTDIHKTYNGAGVAMIRAGILCACLIAGFTAGHYTRPPPQPVHTVYQSVYIPAFIPLRHPASRYAGQQVNRIAATIPAGVLLPPPGITHKKHHKGV